MALAPLSRPARVDIRALEDFLGAFTGLSDYRTAASAVPWPRITALRAGYFAAAVLAVTFAYELMRVPVQLADSLTQLLEAQRSPSVVAMFAEWAHRAAYLRPMFYAEVKALFDLSNGHYWLAYRGFHALLICAALGLFMRALRVRTWDDFAAAMFALTVLTGLHTFRGLVREAFPVSHYLQVAVLCLLALNLARSRGGWLIDAAAAATFVVASLTLESGVLTWVVFVTAWACGMPGISRRGVVILTALLGAYFWLRFGYLSIGTPGFDQRSTGFLLRMLEPADVQQRFGASPLVLYAYNIVTSFLSVLFSEPDGGIFETLRAWMAGDVPPRLYLAVLSSCLATGLIGWVVAARGRDGRRSMRDECTQMLAVSAAVIIANAAMSFVYTKHEILSVAGCFYAVAAFVACRHALGQLRRARPAAGRVALVVILAATASLWAFRSLGVHHMLRVQAFNVRNDWAGVPPDGIARDPDAAALIRQLRHDAIAMRVSNPFLVPRWVDRWLGE